MCACMLVHFSCVWLFATLWTVTCQAPLSMGFSRQEYWSGLPCPPPEDLPNSGIEPASLMFPALAGGFFATSTTLLLSCSVMSYPVRSHGLQHARPPCPSPSPGVCSNSCPLNQWCHPTISSSVISFSSCLQSFPASGSFPMSQLFASGGQSIGASASILPMNIWGWFPSILTGLISLLSMGLSRIFCSITVRKHQFSQHLLNHRESKGIPEKHLPLFHWLR